MIVCTSIFCSHTDSTCLHCCGQRALAEAREKGLVAKLESATRQIEVLQGSRPATTSEASKQSEGEESTMADQDLPGPPINPSEPYEALIASLQADVKRLEAACEKGARLNTKLEQELAEVKSSASDKARVLQSNLEESWER